MKSKFKNLNFAAIEVLTAEQQKNIVGGYGQVAPPKNVWYCPGQTQGPISGAYGTRDDCQKVCKLLNWDKSANAKECQFA